MELQQSSCSEGALAEYLRLFRACFPGAVQYSVPYLKWLYADNPDGYALGFDARIDGQVIAHAIGIPTTVNLRGNDVKALLALNIATHPEFQGRGLFTKLADAMCRKASEEGYSFVFGVANNNALPGWVRRLGFQDVLGLDARFGALVPPSIDWTSALKNADFRPIWTADRLCWRVNNPANKLSIRMKDGHLHISGRTHLPFVRALALLPPAETGEVRESLHSPVYVYLGATPKGTMSNGVSITIPDRLRPSPLRLIYRNLQNSADKLLSDSVIISFIDFDAF